MLRTMQGPSDLDWAGSQTKQQQTCHLPGESTVNHIATVAAEV